MAQGQLAWLHIARQDYADATPHIEAGLPWAARIDGDKLRAEIEAQLLTLSGMVAMMLSRLDEARRTLMAVLSRGEALGKPRLQLGALANLAVVRIGAEGRVRVRNGVGTLQLIGDLAGYMIG